MKTKSILLFILFLVVNNMLAQNFSVNDLYNNYEQFKETTLTAKRFKHADILPLIEKIAKQKYFKLERLGYSVEKRPINMLKIGSGKTVVLAWSQMHGDEPTATMALFDLFNFFSDTTQFKNFKAELLENLTIYFVPMLNPDGAEKFTRRNALKIDLNRDALRLQSPESRILKRLQKRLKPVFGFNLHDQGYLNSVGKTFKSATISVLLPAFNFDKDINNVRSQGMKVIVDMFKNLSVFIPGHIGKYDDSFEPRAFGDNMVKWGTSSILIESGGWKNDYEKQFVRKMNFIAILSAFNSISSKSYNNNNIENYFSIPDNDNYLFDLVIRNIKTKIKDTTIVLDLGINRIENTDKDRTPYFRGNITEIGDLSTFYGNEDYCFDSLQVKPGLVYPTVFENLGELADLDFDNLLAGGYLYIKVKNILDSLKFTKYPINIVSPDFEAPTEISLGTAPNFIILDTFGIKYSIVNGFLYDNLSKKSYIYNGLIL